MLISRDVVKRFGPVAALCGLNLQVSPGEIVGLIGHNGAGKSTFVEVVLGLIRPDAGTVLVGGVDVVRHPRTARRMIGASPQELALYLPATARENLELFGGVAGVDRRRLRRQVVDLLDELDLVAVADKQVRELSGGQQRRVQAGCAMVAGHSLLLLDEPTVGADPSTRQMLLEAVRRRAAAGAAVLYTTHYLPELVDLGATLAVVRAGQVIARGSQQSLLADLPGELVLHFDGPLPARRALDVVDAVVPGCADRGNSGVGQSGDPNQLHLAAADPGSRLPGLLADLAAQDVVPTAVEIRKPGLEDLYRALEQSGVAA